MAVTDPIASVTRAAVRRPWVFLLCAAVVVATSVKLAAGLEVRSDLRELLPDDVPSVAQVKELIQRVGGDGTIYVNLESERGPEGLKAMEALAPVLARDVLALGPDQIRSIELNVLPVQHWYEEHWPLFLSVKDLTKARDAIRAEIKQRKAGANPLAVELDDEEPAAKPAATEDKLLDPKRPLPRAEIRQRFAHYVDGFMVHDDKSSLVMIVRPAGTSLGVGETRALLERVQAVIDKHKPELEREHLRVGMAGSFPLGLAEYESIIKDVFGTALLVVALVLVSILLFFRDLRSVLSLGLATLAAVAVTFGVTRLTIGYLNMQTSFLGAIVLGNGINYGLIYLARVKQLRKQGVGLEEACLSGAHDTARATLLAAAATSVSFGTLIIAANKGFRHFGIIGGMGMLLCWFFTFLLVPAFLSVFERVRAVRPSRPDDIEGRARMLAPLLAHPRAVVATFAVLTVASGAWFLKNLPNEMERNLDNLTNDRRGQSELTRNQDRANKSLGRSIAGSIALLPSREAADAFCDEVDRRSKTPPYDKLIQSCDTISLVLPRAQDEKLGLIREILAEVPESVVKRLPADQAARARIIKQDLVAQRKVGIQDAPPTLIDRFREKDGHVGRLAVVTAKPDAEIGHAENLQSFVAAARNVVIDGKPYDATGENVILADLLRNIEVEGPRTTLISFFGVCALVLVFFRNLRTSLEIMGSLFVGVVLMAGVATVLHLKINFFNFVAYPITFGIAVDYGANVVARVRERGGRVLLALAEAGPSIALCSWTTIVGYGSLLFSLNRALRSFGWYAMIGEMTCIVTALVLLPALLLLVSKGGGDAARN